MRFVCIFFLFVCLWAPAAYSQGTPTNCPHINQSGDHALRTWSKPATGSCHTVKRNGFLVPDPKCTPGAINPSLTITVLKNPKFRTGCVRNDTTTEGDKAQTYEWYSITHPANNQGETQTCELDHLIPLYLGGADTLDNIWPQCGPDSVALDDRYFREKDRVEYYLGQQVRDGKMTLSVAQRGIAHNWTQYLNKAEEFCSSGKCDFRGQ